MENRNNRGGWPLNYTPGQKKGRGTPAIDDGIPGNFSTSNQRRTRLRRAGVYNEYLEWKKEGKTYDEFQLMRAKRDGNYRYISYQAKNDGLTRGKRKYKSVKERSQKMMKEGVKFEDTPLGKTYDSTKASHNKPHQCKMCPLVTANYLLLREHIQRAHSKLIIDMAAAMTPEELENLQILNNAFDGDLQFKAAHYMKISGSTIGQFIRWTGKGKDSSLTNALIDRPKFKTAATAHGIKWEQEAIRQYARIYNVPNVVAQNRNFPHPSGFLTATTDGLIGEHGLLEIKCPSDSIPDMLKKRRHHGFYLQFCAFGENGLLRLNRSSDYFYQVIAQLICSGRAYLDFVVAYRDNAMETTNENERWSLWRETIFYTEAAWHWHFIEEKTSTVYNYAASLITVPSFENPDTN